MEMSEAMEIFSDVAIEIRDYNEVKVKAGENPRIGGRTQYRKIVKGGEQGGLLKDTNYEKGVRVGWEYLYPLAVEPKKNEQRRSDSILRTKKELQFFTVGNYITGKTLFLTLTQKENEENLDVAKSYLVSFLKKLQYNHNNIGYIWVAERQARGSIHFHIMITGISFIPIEEITEYWGKGHCWIEHVEDSDSMNYLSKYISKSPETFESGQRIWGRSRNLKRPEEFWTNQKYKINGSVLCSYEFENEYVGRAAVDLWRLN